ncbi:tripartite tricarboxylate transporter substrate binding protein [Roseovarius sp. SCSIO 43702]|uniref:Bug family tripartite tricarboxylate transporter substrate binding protein n=1 Tax=Roseovarius sp. SCSIO 43702 TaxID=2823043 RepID=UPI001C7364E2|nr:tripartite tricarboxylate transporter substrate binding protein [Roseovarius sp. SCSIO 43702]QYX57596.1 tripartite tricarboxylate transporter substrate binding protein [Roseovarius sp. SCSIO 43702]
MKQLGFIAALAMGALTLPAVAQDYPARDIDLVVPFDPGGSVDTTSRIIAETANTILDGVEMNVVNRSGGGGVVGQTSVAQADPDGYTVLAMTSSVVTNPKMKGAGYAVSDFRPVALYNLDPEVIVVPAESPIETIEDFMAKAESEGLNIVVAGVGTSHHMSGLAIERVTDAKFNYIPTKGFGAQVQAVAGGHADGALWPLGEATAQAESGAVRILAIAAEERSDAFPDAPTFQEAGIDIPIFATFRGWAVPAATPDEAVAFLQDLLKQVSETEAYVEKMESAGYTPTYRDAEGFQFVVDNYADLTSVIIDEAGLGQ